MNTITAKRTHFPRTFPEQRKLLFHTWQTTGDVKFACYKAHVSERTFYKWKPRFSSGGYEALPSAICLTCTQNTSSNKA